MSKMVFHLSESTKFKGALANLRNLIKASPEVITIELVANSQAVIGYTEAEYQAQVSELQSQGVLFSACQNALNSLNLTGDDLFAGTQVVPAGVYRIYQLQEAGYHYLKV